MKKILLLPAFLLAITACSFNKIKKSSYSLEDLLSTLTEIDNYQDEIDDENFEALKNEEIPSYSYTTDAHIMIPGISFLKGFEDAYEHTKIQYDNKNNIGYEYEAYEAINFSGTKTFYEFVDGDYGYQTHDVYKVDDDGVTDEEYFYKTTLESDEAKERFNQSIENDYREKYFEYIYDDVVSNSFANVYKDMTPTTLYTLDVRELGEGLADFSFSVTFETYNAKEDESTGLSYYYFDARIEDYKNIGFTLKQYYFYDEYQEETDDFEFEYALIAGTYSFQLTDEEIELPDITDYEER